MSLHFTERGIADDSAALAQISDDEDGESGEEEEAKDGVN